VKEDGKSFWTHLARQERVRAGVDGDGGSLSGQLFDAADLCADR